MEPMRAFQAVLHEAAHAKLHYDLVSSMERGTVVDTMAETEAHLQAILWESKARLAVGNYVRNSGLRLDESGAVKLMLLYLGGHEDD